MLVIGLATSTHVFAGTIGSLWLVRSTPACGRLWEIAQSLHHTWLTLVRNSWSLLMADLQPGVPSPLSLATLPPIDDMGRVLAVIEAVAGSRNKLKFDPATGALALHTMLPLGASFPYAFGFVPSTRGEDGDPIDVLVFLDEQVPPGVVVPCRLVGVILATQTKDGANIRNDRLLAVAEKSHQYRRVHALADLDRSVLSEIERFFEFYNAQKGEEFTPLGRHGTKRAWSIIRKGGRAWDAAVRSAAKQSAPQPH